LRFDVLNSRDTSHPRSGGAELVIDEVAQIWAGSGHEAATYCSWSPGLKHQRVGSFGIDKPTFGPSLSEGSAWFPRAASEDKKSWKRRRDSTHLCAMSHRQRASGACCPGELYSAIGRDAIEWGTSCNWDRTAEVLLEHLSLADSRSR
jgi:hypothetical protein